MTTAKLARLAQHLRLVLQRRAKVVKLAPLAMEVAEVVDLTMVDLKRLHQPRAPLSMLRAARQRTPLP